MDMFSLLVPTFNGSKWIESTIRSALEQTYSNIEIVVTDDGSTDSTVEIARSLPRTQVFVNPSRLWPEASVNQGFRRSKGSYVGFLGQDDLLLPEKVELTVEALRGNPSVDVSHGDAILIDELGRRIGYFQGQSVEDPLQLLNSNPIPVGSVTMRRSAFERVGGFRQGLFGFGDYDLWLRLVCQSKFSYLPRPLYQYRRWSGQLTATRSLREDLRRMRIRGALRDAIEMRRQRRIVARIRRDAAARFHAAGLTGPAAGTSTGN